MKHARFRLRSYFLDKSIPRRACVSKTQYVTIHRSSSWHLASLAQNILEFVTHPGVEGHVSNAPTLTELLLGRLVPVDIPGGYFLQHLLCSFRLREPRIQEDHKRKL